VQAEEDGEIDLVEELDAHRKLFDRNIRTCAPGRIANQSLIRLHVRVKPASGSVADALDDAQQVGVLLVPRLRVA
jgi:hypothetical protein